jgi:hypothetical protein
MDEREDVSMDKESDAELEKINKLMKPHVQSYLSSEEEDNTKETTFMFQLELVMCQMSVILLYLQMAINQQSINQSINQPTNQLTRCLQHTCKSPSSGRLFWITLDESNHYFHTINTSAQLTNITTEEICIFFAS